MSRLTQEEIDALKGTEEYASAFATALEIHKKVHDPNATHFRDCIECKSGFALLLGAGLQKLKNEDNPH